MALVACPECGKNISTSAPACPHCGYVPIVAAAPPPLRQPAPAAAPLQRPFPSTGQPPQPKPPSVGAVLGWLALTVVGAIVLIAIFGSLFASPRLAQTGLTNRAAPTAIAQPMPASERDFIAAVDRGRAAYAAGTTDFQKGAARPSRARDICQALVGMAVDGWVGTIVDLSTNNGGQGVVKIAIAPDIHVMTWNNELSDILSATLIKPNTPVFRSLFALQPKQEVVFSGTLLPSTDDCAQEGSLSLYGSMTDPEFIFRFSKIAPPPARPAS